MNQNLSLHERAVAAALAFKKADAELLTILMEVDASREFLNQGYATLFSYCTQALKLSESHSAALCSVARKSREVPELKAKIDQGEIHLSNARRIVSVITQDNQAEWIGKASELSQRELEREIVKEKPRAALCNEKIRPVAEALSELRVYLSPEQEQKLARVRDLVAQKKQAHLSLAETLEAAFDDFIRRHDPVVKAVRASAVSARSDSQTCPDKIAEPVAAPQSCPGKVADPVAAPQSCPSKIAVPVTALHSCPDMNAVPVIAPHLCPGKNAVSAVAPALIHGKRTARPAAITHAVHRRDGGRCTFVLPNGKRCEQQRWTELHHPVLVSHGGKHSPDNLITLCGAHHRALHRGALARKASV